jgi:hypothetical protein
MLGLSCLVFLPLCWLLLSLALLGQGSLAAPQDMCWGTQLCCDDRYRICRDVLSADFVALIVGGLFRQVLVAARHLQAGMRGMAGCWLQQDPMTV